MSNEKLESLLKKQASEREDLDQGAYSQWLPIAKKEKELLAEFNGKYENASQHIQQLIHKARAEYFDEWRNEGRLAALLAERQAKERERHMKKEKILTQLKESLDDQIDHDNWR